MSKRCSWAITVSITEPPKDIETSSTQSSSPGTIKTEQSDEPPTAGSALCNFISVNNTQNDEADRFTITEQLSTLPSIQ